MTNDTQIMELAEILMDAVNGFVSRKCGDRAQIEAALRCLPRISAILTQAIQSFASVKSPQPQPQIAQTSDPSAWTIVARKERKVPSYIRGGAGRRNPNAQSVTKRVVLPTDNDEFEKRSASAHHQKPPAHPNAARDRSLTIPQRFLAHPDASSTRPNPAGQKYAHAIPGVITIDSFGKVTQPGILYFIDWANHYAVKIGGILFHGNIGTIYQMRRVGKKITDCVFRPCKKRDCNYYHDPLWHPNSTDCRNFLSDQAANNVFPAHPLELAAVSADNFRQYRDRTMHDLLCVIFSGFARS